MGSERGKATFWRCYGNYKGRKAAKPFLKYARAHFEESERDLAYRIYMTDSIKAVAGGLGHLSGQGYVLNKRFAEIILPELNKNSEKEQETSAETDPEIVIERIKRKLRGEIA